MVTLEWTMKNHFFQKWASPFEESAYLYEKLDRAEEARDTARLALRQPWWSVGNLARCVFVTHTYARATLDVHAYQIHRRKAFLERRPVHFCAKHRHKIRLVVKLYDDLRHLHQETEVRLRTLSQQLTCSAGYAK